MKTRISRILLIMLLIMFTLEINIRRVEANNKIYIRADGSIEPDTAPISSIDNITYTFTGDINESVVVERDNIIIDGAEHLLQAPPEHFMTTALNLFNRTKVTVKDLHIANSSLGIGLTNSTNCHINGNNITNNGNGIYGDYSFNNSITGNNITAYKMNVTLSSGIYLNYAINNSISGNNIESHNTWGIYLMISSNNTLSGNYIANNNVGIAQFSATGNSISGNNMTNNGFGVGLGDSSNNIISGNNITNSILFAINLHSSHNNTISGNIFDDGLAIYESYDNVVLNNLVNGKPLVYLEEASDRVVKDAGQVILINCNRMRVENLSLSHTSIGVELWKTNSSTITGNDITTNKQFSFYGILIYYSHDNSISGNKITNIGAGIELRHSSCNTITENHIINNTLGISCERSTDNHFYHNNFMENSYQVADHFYAQVNIWDDGYPSGGNYWSNYNGTDSDDDGIGDTPYIISEYNQDNYPLMCPKPRNPLFGDMNYDFIIDMRDVGRAAWSIGSFPTHQRWNIEADVNQDSRVDIKDLIIIARHFGET